MPSVRLRAARGGLALIALAALALGAAPPIGAAPNSPGAATERAVAAGPADGWYTIRAAHSGKCLGPLNDSSAGGVQIVQQPCDGRSTQRVYLQRNGVSEGKDWYVAYATGQCWGNTLNGYRPIGTRIHRTDCNQYYPRVGFHFDYVDWRGGYVITPVLNDWQGQCLHVQDASVSDDAVLILHVCSNTGLRNDVFTLQPV